MSEILSHEDEGDIKALFLGRRVVSAEIQTFPEETRGLLVLDDGTKIYVVPNEGCSPGICWRGSYDVTRLATTDNVITDVRLLRSEVGYGVLYQIFVLCGDDEINIMTAEGNDDNSDWYGTGYRLICHCPCSACVESAV